MINFEGGAIPEEYHNEYVVDRVETTATVWMGTTLGCARCHDHKYDPFKQRDFYRFYAFFNNVPEKGLDGREGNVQPVVQIPSPDQRRRLDELVQRINAIEKALPEQEIASLQSEWERTALSTVSPRERAPAALAPAARGCPGWCSRADVTAIVVRSPTAVRPGLGSRHRAGRRVRSRTVPEPASG